MKLDPNRINEFRDFLKSEFWANLSKAKRESMDNKCQNCPNTTNLKCRFLFFKDSFYSVKMEDLVVLCEKCNNLANSCLKQTERVIKRTKRSRRKRFKNKKFRV